ncbi:peptidase S8/S53 domain-containing protein [Ilyonectria robusta]|uniref:peptidase S8/S53 domain-containing protein n=1 Tax=Ilyonectria robusta TaxID=1079257 RepID=UPI001E8E29A0|nr:peptidase S8/S53 domain-containing protein [Ilyonectria robusta]KAH8672327.1 peptidase S8/S53 domain-containing protein [Ilyonectria robusta]
MSTTGQRLSSEATTIGDMEEYANLQIVCSDYTIDNLREATVEVTEFNGTMIRLLGEPAVAPKDTEDTEPTKLSTQRESFYQSLWSRSSELFNSLIRHLQPCTDRHDKHRAMLHLTQHRFSAAESDARNNEKDRGFCAYYAGEYLAIQVADSNFSDVSVTLLDQRPPPPSAAPTKSLLELSGDGVLKPGGKFSPKHKKVLACALSHALLCLHDKSAGPWLQAFWNLRNVFFLQESNGHMVFWKAALGVGAGDEVKTLLGPREVNIYNLKDLNDEDAPEDPGESYREVVRNCLMFPKIWNEEQIQSAGVSAQDVIFRRIVEPLRKAVDALGPEAWRPANLDLKAGGIRLEDAGALPVGLSVQGIERPANITLSPGTLGQLAAKPSIHFGFGRCFTSQIPTESSSSIQELEHTIKERFQPGATDERIRIAVLDTGMDDGEYAKNENKELKKPPWKRVVARSNFCVPKEEDLNANTHDLDGHGTKVASIILRLAENVDLYIARVCRGADVEEADRNKDTEFKDPEPAVVARAINWAVEQKVHVINLSLGYRDEQKHPGISDLRTALERAVKQQILVFAATSNEGLTADVTWPAKNLTYAIGIHSSTDNGRPSEFIGKASNEANLMVVGERILSYGRRGEPQLCSGTLFATPVAAAVGAMILAFVGQRPVRSKSRI